MTTLLLVILLYSKTWLVKLQDLCFISSYYSQKLIGLHVIHYKHDATGDLLPHLCTS